MFFLSSWGTRQTPLHINGCLRKSPVSNGENHKPSESFRGQHSIEKKSLLRFQALNLKKLPTSLNIETPQHNSHLYSTFHSARSDPLSSPTPWFPVGSMESCWQANRVTWLTGRSHWSCKSQAWASFEFTAVNNPLQTVQKQVRPSQF